ncbi:hypothetical protein ACFHW2_33110 [Actinomadura sp. LOL_016]|uniref:hypothetical protein n=1 Tax=unclassified Actinomadura TaxID=2626254 RepID=UPI003A81147F
MRFTRTGFILTTAALVIAGAASTASAGSFTDPAPGGPLRPHEPDVTGPRNLDGITVQATRNAGRSVTIAFDRRSRTAQNTVPAAARRFVFLFDRSISFNPEAFPTCARTTIDEQGVRACPPGSQVGSGRLTAFDGTEQDVLLFNSRINGMRGALVVIPQAGMILEQTFERASAPYRRNHRWTLDEIVPPTSVPPGQRAGTARFELSFGATRVVDGRPVGFAETTARPGTRLRFGLWSEFVTGQTALPTDTARLR